MTPLINHRTDYTHLPIHLMPCRDTHFKTNKVLLFFHTVLDVTVEIYNAISNESDDVEGPINSKKSKRKLIKIGSVIRLLACL